MKFEKPIMNISMFEIENVVTESGSVNPPQVEKNIDNAIADAAGKAAGKNAVAVTVTF